jgi:hypothetical protein
MSQISKIPNITSKGISSGPGFMLSQGMLDLLLDSVSDIVAIKSGIYSFLLTLNLNVYKDRFVFSFNAQRGRNKF